MNWKLILSLSLFGLFMAFGTTYFIPSKTESLCWLIVFFISARQIGKDAEERYFLHGFLVSLVNSIWMVAIHSILLTAYVAHHTRESKDFLRIGSQLGITVTQAMLIMEPVNGILSGIALGVMSFIASKFY